MAHEKALLHQGHVVVGLDEVGRGAVAGPLTVGAVVVPSTTRAPKGVDDSKRLTPAARETLVPLLQRWSGHCATGSASANEIDEWGLTHALCLAAWRALDALSVTPSCALIDGPINFLIPHAGNRPAPPELRDRRRDVPLTRTIVRGDQISIAIAAASIIAKVARDGEMTALHDDYPEYKWARNKGYLSTHHAAAIARYGVTQVHRRSWALPGNGQMSILPDDHEVDQVQ